MQKHATRPVRPLPPPRPPARAALVPPPAPAPVPRMQADDALGATLARVVAGHTPITMVQREIDIIGPDSQETPESVWNAFQSASMKTTTWTQKKRTYDEFMNRPPPDPSIPVNPFLAKLKKPPPPTDPGPRPPEAVTSWLAVRDVYAGLTETGNTSWPGLVRARFGAEGSAQASKFTIFTGMHGNIGGQFLDRDELIDIAYKDTKHTAEDVKTAGELETELGCEVKVVDVFAKKKLRKPATLMAEVKNEVKQGSVVILAWCYSMEAFKSVPSTITPDTKGDKTPGTPEKLYATQRRRMTVQDLVADTFGTGLVAGYMRPASVLPALREKVAALNAAMVKGDPDAKLRAIIGEAAALWAGLDDHGRGRARVELLTALSKYYVKLPSPKPKMSTMSTRLGFAGL